MSQGQSGWGQGAGSTDQEQSWKGDWGVRVQVQGLGGAGMAGESRGGRQTAPIFPTEQGKRSLNE